MDFIGDAGIIKKPLVAVFSSVRCPGRLILRAHDYAKEIREGEMGVVSGFRSPAEKEVLEVLLKGRCPIVVVLGRWLGGARIPAAWKKEIEKERLLLVSPFKSYQKQVTKEMSLKSNDVAARLAGRVLIIHAQAGGSLQSQVGQWQADGLSVVFLDGVRVVSYE